MKRRSPVLRVEGLEDRRVLSVVVPLMQAQGRMVHVAQSGGTGSGGSGQGGGGQTPPNQFINPTGNPTPHEVRRQAVRFVCQGRYVQGPGRFDDEVSQTLIKGVGGSNLFLHGDLQLGAVVPTDPSVGTSGTLVAYDRSINGNSAIGLDLKGSTADLDRGGRPTRFTFTVNLNLAAGVFGQSQGTGTVRIRYVPDARSRPGAVSGGKAFVVITGEVYTLGINNILGAPFSRINSTDPSRVRA